MRNRRLCLMIASIIGATVAVGSPTSRSSGIPSATNSLTVVLLIDVSELMRANDVAPTRFDAMVSSATSFLAGLPPRVRVGLVAFSSKARVVQVPTTNRQVIAGQLLNLRPAVGNGLGTGLAAAVDLASRHRPAAILFAAGGSRDSGDSPLVAATRAKAFGIRVYGVAIGTKHGKVLFSFGSYSNSVPAPTDPKPIKQVAQITGGKAFVAENALRLRSAFTELAALIAR